MHSRCLVAKTNGAETQRRRGDSGADYWPRKQTCPPRLPQSADNFYLCFPNNPERPGSRVVVAVLSIRSAMAAVGSERATTGAAARWRHIRQILADLLLLALLCPFPLLFVSRISEALVGRAYMLGVVSSRRCWAFRLRAPSSRLSCHNFVSCFFFFCCGCRRH